MHSSQQTMPAEANFQVVVVTDAPPEAMPAVAESIKSVLRQYGDRMEVVAPTPPHRQPMTQPPGPVREMVEMLNKIFGPPVMFVPTQRLGKMPPWSGVPLGVGVEQELSIARRMVADRDVHLVKQSNELEIMRRYGHEKQAQVNQLMNRLSARDEQVRDLERQLGADRDALQLERDQHAATSRFLEAARADLKKYRKKPAARKPAKRPAKKRG
jgi:hypothetical protein